MLAACLEAKVMHCPDVDCPQGRVCDDHKGCVLPEQLVVCARAVDGAPCSYVGTPDGTCNEGVCRPVGCGNNMVTSAEVCDDGNTTNGDGCSADCRSLEICGNGIIDSATGEQCDDGNLIDGDGCQTNCLLPRCGDGAQDSSLGEACDLGPANSTAPDAECRPNCQRARCGDGVVDSSRGEVCDDGNELAGDGCSPGCTSLEVCGNNIVDVAKGEQCDDGNASNADLCHNDCKIATCGDHITDAILNEACDDGDMNANAPDQCRTNCQLPRCGDNIVDTGEVCDDGNLDTGDGCRPDCLSNEVCGNGIVDVAVGERCDDGNARGYDGCSSCQDERISVRTPGEVPSTRAYLAMAYDAARERVVLFGGYNNGQDRSDTWEWDGVSWTELRPQHIPPRRDSHVMAYDPVRHRVVMFGGYVSFGDTWEWDGTDWHNMNPATAPSNRYYAAMAFDPVRGHLVLYGGYSVSLGAYVGDMWEWTGTTWMPITPNTNPGARGGHSMALDAAHGEIVMYGGNSDHHTWTWNGIDWTDHGDAPAAMPQNYLAAMAYDPVRARVVVADGVDQTWEWDGTSWTSIDAPSPTARRYSAMAYDLARRQQVLIGGYDAQYLNDTWLRTGTSWAPAPAWSEPSARFRAAAAYDPLRQRVVMFGGSTGTPFRHSATDETWEWDGLRWTQIAATTPPSARGGQWMAYDSKARQIVLYGGSHADAVGAKIFDANLYGYDGMSWMPRSTMTPRPIDRTAAMCYDDANQRVTTFGGRSSVTDDDLDTTWSWDDTIGWTLASPPASPAARRNMGIAYDPVRQQTVMFGGYNDADGSLGDTWEWDGATSTWRDASASGPSPRYGLELVYNPDRARVTLFGDLGAVEDDLWEWNGATWTDKIMDQPIPQQYRGAVAYDAVRHVFVVFGGRDQSSVPAAATRLVAFRPNAVVEACTSADLDYDNDGKAGCDDDECWARCTPLCPPGVTCPVFSPKCGDGTCSSTEDCQLCPLDCGGCTDNVCGDYHCDVGETQAACAVDCP